MKLRHKFFLADLILLTIAISATSIFTLRTIEKEFRTRAATDLEQRLKCLHELLHHKGTEFKVADGKLMAGSYIINDNFELPDKVKEIFGGSATIFMGDMRVSTNVLKQDGSRATGTRLQGPAHDAVFREGKPYRGETLILGEPYFTAYDPMRDASGRVIGVLYVGAKQSEYLAAYNRLQVALIAMTAVLALGFAFLSFLMVRRSLQPLTQMVELNHRLAEGDLSVDIHVRGKDEIGQLADSSRKVLTNLNSLIAAIKNTASEVASSSTMLSAVSENIASNSELVVQQIVAVGTASEEMSATSSEIARSCVAAADSSQRGEDVASEGVEVVRETVAGMSRIAEKVKDSAKTVAELGQRSEKIGLIVGTIEDIADQTNLLALNAAIEAARAGEQGRGFAVVADEVRALAARTAQATKEIGEMIKAVQRDTRDAVNCIEQSVTEVETGTRDAVKSGEALESILDQIHAVAQQINQIATAAEEQTTTTSEITGNILNISEVVQMSAECSRDSASAAGELSSHADQLLRLVGNFTLAR